MTDFEDRTVRLAALEGWASNPTVPIAERLNAAMQVIAELRDELAAAKTRVVDQTSFTSGTVTWVPGLGPQIDAAAGRQS